MTTLTPRFDFDGYDPTPRNNLRALHCESSCPAGPRDTFPDWSFKATGDGAERFCDKLLLKWRHRAIKLTVSPPRLGVPAAPGSGRLVGDSYTAQIGRASMVTPELA